MLRNRNLWIGILFFLILGVVVRLIFPFSVDSVRASVAIAPEILFTVAGFDVTPTLLTSVLVFVIITVVAVFSTRNLQLVPNGAQNVMEAVIEGLITLFESIAGPKWRDFFTIAASIFLLVIVSNFIGLIPGAGSIGVIKVGEETHTRIENGQVCYEHPETKECTPSGIYVLGDVPDFIKTTTLYNKRLVEAGKEEEVEEHAALVPLIRAPSSDINLPLALALVSVIMTQVYGMRAQGLRYWTRFFSFRRLLRGDITFGLIDAFVGLVELISELGKIIAFTFRLFGNIFAGEVILLIMAFLFLMLPFPFYGLEFFVAFIQAFVFAVLTVAFMRLATAEHGSQGHSESH